jgi:UDP:flavonoid glycosyltransferase YjiC (YdhE family)
LSRFLLATWSGGGNLTPFLAIADGLVRRDHDVDVVTTHELGGRLPTLPGVRCHVQTDRPFVPDLDAAIAATAPDALVVDFMMPEALTAAEASGVPTAALAHTRYAPVLDRRVDLVGAFSRLDVINDDRTNRALPAVDHPAALLDQLDRVWATLPRALDGSADRALPANARYLGALLDPTGDARWNPPWPEEDRRPLVVVALGTTPMDEGPVLARVVEGLAAGGDLRVLVTVGDHVDPATVPAPGDVVVTAYVPHAVVLPHAAAVVTHAGLGTTIAAVTFGLPVVCVPLGRDQPGNAERVAEAGAGIVLSTDATAGEFAGAVRQVLDDPSFAAASAALGPSPAETVDAALDEVESLAAVRPRGA